MARNRVQFQKGLSDRRFGELYGTEELCRAALFAWRWPDGFVCPRCGGGAYSEVRTRGLLQCRACRHQASLTAGTIFHRTHLALTTWFLAMHLIGQSKNGISSLELSRRLGVNYDTAWKLHHKLMQVMLEREADQPLGGGGTRVEIDDAYLGGSRSGGKRGRGAPGKTPFVAAVETAHGGKPHRLKLAPVKGFRKAEIRRLARRAIAPGSTVVSDGLSCFTAIAEAGSTHYPMNTGSGPQAAKWQAFTWVNTSLGNVKNSIRGTFHAIRPKHVARYLAQFQYRFNRRYHLEAIIPRLAWVALRTPPMPYNLLKLAEASG